MYRRICRPIFYYVGLFRMIFAGGMRVVGIIDSCKGWKGTVVGYSRHHGDNYLEVRFDKEFYDYHDKNLEWFERDADSHTLKCSSFVLEEVYNTKLWNVLE
jgi:hypothetical protein